MMKGMIKTYALIAAFALILSALPSMAHAQDITTGLIGHWKLDETSGTTAVDSAGNSDGTMDGGLSGANSFAGRINTALYFD